MKTRLSFLCIFLYSLNGMESTAIIKKEKTDVEKKGQQLLCLLAQMQPHEQNRHPMIVYKKPTRFTKTPSLENLPIQSIPISPSSPDLNNISSLYLLQHRMGNLIRHADGSSNTISEMTQAIHIMTMALQQSYDNSPNPEKIIEQDNVSVILKRIGEPKTIGSLVTLVVTLGQLAPTLIQQTFRNPEQTTRVFTGGILTSILSFVSSKLFVAIAAGVGAIIYKSKDLYKSWRLWRSETKVKKFDPRISLLEKKEKEREKREEEKEKQDEADKHEFKEAIKSLFEHIHIHDQRKNALQHLVQDSLIEVKQEMTKTKKDLDETKETNIQLGQKLEDSTHALETLQTTVIHTLKNLCEKVKQHDEYIPAFLEQLSIIEKRLNEQAGIGPQKKEKKSKKSK